MRDDLALFGIQSDAIEAWSQFDEGPVEFEVWPENWTTVQAFLAMSTQWHRAGMEGQRVGLYYPSLDAVYEGLEIRKKDRSRVFRGLQTMEGAALHSMI